MLTELSCTIPAIHIGKKFKFTKELLYIHFLRWNVLKTQTRTRENYSVNVGHILRCDTLSGQMPSLGTPQCTLFCCLKATSQDECPNASCSLERQNNRTSES